LKESKSEYWIPDISSRAAFGRWTHRGGQDIVKSAREKARKLLGEHHPSELSPGTKEGLRRIVKDFETRA
jgi:trimethylamine:corrinoid methyltransferase-like protein